MTVHQHRDQTAVDQIRPAAVFRLGQVLGDDMHAVVMPVTLDLQSVRVAATAAITNAIRRCAVLQGGVDAGHTGDP
ncbi:hypothetical protein D3C73_1401170 [compost metagenome]